MRIMFLAIVVAFIAVTICSFTLMSSSSTDFDIKEVYGRGEENTSCSDLAAASWSDRCASIYERTGNCSGTVTLTKATKHCSGYEAHVYCTPTEITPKTVDYTCEMEGHSCVGKNPQEDSDTRAWCEESPMSTW